MIEKRRLPKEFFYLTSCLLVFFLLSLTGVFRPLRGWVERSAIVPLRQNFYEAKRLIGKTSVVDQNRDEGRIAELEAQIAILKEENKEQKRLLSAPLPKNWQFLTVKVIDFNNETLILDAGERDGVILGMVLILENTYLGKVSEVSERMSKVRLPSYYEEKLVVEVVSGETIVGKGLLVGRGEGKMRVEQIFSSEAVKKEDLVVLEIEGGTLLVGKIKEVVQEQNDVFKMGQVEKLYDPAQLNTVFLIKGKI